MLPATLTTDVVVIGAGPGGMAAVAAAGAAGADVVAVEARDHIGGNAVWSTGYLAFVGSAMQAAQGIVDSEDRFVADARRIADRAAEQYGVVWDEPLVRLFARESAETYRVLVERGVRFSRFIPRPRQHSVDRMAATVDTWAYRTAFQPDFERPGTTTLYGTSARRLVVENGRVSGVVVAPVAGGDPCVVTASRGVVLATGGYQANPELRLRHQPERLARGPYLGVETARGDGHLLGQSVGGDLVNMGYIAPLVIVSSSLVEDAIAVNREGHRFHDEAGPYEERVAAVEAQPGRRGWYLFDAVVADEKAQLVEQMPGRVHTSGDLDGLARALGVEPGALIATVRRWNADLDAGVPDQFRRVVLPPGRRRIEHGPFTAVEMVVGVNFSSGGFRVTSELAVLDVFGDPIPGLWAAGDCVGALGPVADLGGTRICGGFTFGRLAGRAAARSAAGVPDPGNPAPYGAFLPHRLDRRTALVDVGSTADPS